MQGTANLPSVRRVEAGARQRRRGTLRARPGQSVREALRMIIAIDGPAASGKGTIARRLAAHYGLPHLDTGLLYRATAATLIAEGRDLHDEDSAVSAARGLGLTDFDEAALRSRQMAEAASVVAAMPGVRAALIEAQRSFAARPGGAVLDGRDIGTVICPNATVKIFVTASAAARAQRRVVELANRGERADYSAVLADILRRDARDSERAAAPLRPADDAAQLDTTHLGIESAFAEALRIVESARIRA
jgi:CMP/dCMP kinase